MDYLSVAAHDAFRNGGLGKSAAEVYWFLCTYGPMTDRELSDRTGRSLRTVQRVLSIMSRMADTVTGEFISLVELDGQQWRGNNVDLNHVAMIVGTAGTAKQQRAQHKREREAHLDLLAARKKQQQTDTAGQEVDPDA